ncbi:MAG: hypothetical protein IJ799_03045, partial [Bacteroidales bacterium]|nr:hypothetical protein [Bacteroidales bacterium]
MNKFRFLTSLAAAFIAAACLSAATPAFMARWSFDSDTKASGTWTSGHTQEANVGAATLSFVGANPVFGYNKNSSVTVSGISEGDYFLLTAPCGRLPKGADIDLGFYMGMDKAGGPEKWIAEYFDGKKWTGGVKFTVKKYKNNNETSL